MPTRAEANLEASKLDDLARAWEMTPGLFIEKYVLEDVVPGICMDPDCDYTTEVEPDQHAGWCENCGTPSVRSGIVLAGLI